MHTQTSVGSSKVASGRHFLEALNPTINVVSIQERATAGNLAAILPSVDVVLDCTDNFATRQLINAACAAHRVALVSGSALRLDGQLSVFDVKRADSPCYACIFSPDEVPEEINCATMGVFSPLVGIIGTMQAAQALQVLIGFGSPLIGRLLLWNARNTQIETIHISRNPDCPVCGQHHPV
jgi:molybdopterin/thiamine biosynthesis adenylyltransferase